MYSNSGISFGRPPRFSRFHFRVSLSYIFFYSPLSEFRYSATQLHNLCSFTRRPSLYQLLLIVNNENKIFNGVGNANLGKLDQTVDPITRSMRQIGDVFADEVDPSKHFTPIEHYKDVIRLPHCRALPKLEHYSLERNRLVVVRIQFN